MDSFRKRLTFFSHIRVRPVIHGFQVLVTQLKDFKHKAELEIKVRIVMYVICTLQFVFFLFLTNGLMDLKESSRNNLRIHCGIDIHKLKKVLCTIDIYIRMRIKIDFSFYIMP